MPLSTTSPVLSGKADSVLDRADKLLADNSDAIRTTMTNVSAFSKTLNDNNGNIDATLKGFGDLGKNIEPLAARLQTLSDDADKVVKAVEPDKVRGVIDNAQTFSKALAKSSDDYQALMRDGAALRTAQRHVDQARRGDRRHRHHRSRRSIRNKVARGSSIPSSDVAEYRPRENRGNIDSTLKNATEISAKLNESADKLDGLIESAQSFLGAPGTKGALGSIGDAAQSVKKLADDVDVRVKEISVGLTRFSSSGLRQYEALAVQGQRVLDDIDQTARSFKQNPSQLIWGAKPSLPEYRGGQ